MAASPPTTTGNDVPLASDRFLVQQSHPALHDGEGQQGQPSNQGSRNPVEPFPGQVALGRQVDNPSLLKESSTHSNFAANLLTRPTFKALELKQGFEYGPPIPIASDQFIRRICNPAPINQKDPQPESHSTTRFPTTATKPLSPKGSKSGPPLDEDLTNQGISSPPSRARIDRGLLVPEPIPRDVGTLRLALKRKNDHAQVMAPPFSRPQRADTRTQVTSTDNRAVPTRPHVEGPSHPSVGPLEMPMGRNNGQREPEFSRSGEDQERARSHNERSVRETVDVGNERSMNSGAGDNHYSQGRVNSQPSVLEPNKRQRQHPNTSSTRPPAGFSPSQSKTTATRGRKTDGMSTREDDLTCPSSNVSKGRSTNHGSHQVLELGLTSSELNEALTSSPAIQTRKNTHELSTSMATAINKFSTNQNSALEHQKAHYKTKLRAFQRKVDKLLGTVESFKKRDSDQVKELRALADQTEGLKGQLKLKEAELQAVTNDFSAYRDNSAKTSDDKQRLIDQFQKRIGELSKEVQGMKSVLVQSRDLEERTEACKQDAERRVREEQTAKEEAHLQLASVKQQIADMEHYLELEKARSQALEERLEDLKATSKTTETFSAQYDEVIRRLEEKDAQMRLDREKCNDGSSSKLDAITERFEGLAQILSVQSGTLSKLESQCMSDADFESIKSKLEAIIEYQNNHSKEAVPPLFEDLQESVRGIQKQLDDREDLLRQQLEEKIKENHALSALSKEKETEVRYCKAELEAERERSSCLEAEQQDLQEAISLIDASQDHAAETELQLASTRKEVVRLQEEMMSKAAQIKELENKLEERSQTIFEESKHFSEHSMKLTQMLHEKDEITRAAIIQAEEVARREVHIDMEREIEQVKRLQYQTQQQRDSLSERIERMNEKIAHNEESMHKDTITIASLRESITELENRCERLTQEKTAREAQLNRVQAQDSQTLEGLKAEIATIRTEAMGFEQNARSQVTKGQQFFAALKQLAEEQGLSHSVAEDLESLFEGKIGVGDVIPRIAQAVDQFIGLEISRVMNNGDRLQSASALERESKFFPNLISLLSKTRLADDLQSKRYPAGNSNLTANEDPLMKETDHDGLSTSHAARLQSEERRVVIRSPVDYQPEPSPPTIYQEKTRRRQGPQPKSIMKPITRSMASQFWSPVVSDPESLLRAGQHGGLEVYELTNIPTSAQHGNTPPANSLSSSTTGNEHAGSQNAGARLGKKSSEARTSTVPSSARRKRGKKGDQRDPLGVVPENPGPQGTVPGDRFEENSSIPGSRYANKGKGLFQPRGGGVGGDDIIDDDDNPLPRRVLRGSKTSSRKTSGTPGEGEEASPLKPPFQKDYGVQQSASPAQKAQLESKEASQSNHWLPKTGTQDSPNFLNGGGQSRDDPFRLSPDPL